MKKFLYIVFFFACSYLSAQPYGNEWINYSQKYYKFKIVKDGIYRIDSTSLANLGIPLSTIDPQNFQVFGRGAELSIYVEGEGDGKFNSGDFIEFYAQRNTGFLDSLIYRNAQYPANPYFSLFNDTATYYLTWNSSTSNKRMTIEDDVDFASYPVADNYFWKESLDYLPETYYYGSTDYGEGTSPYYTPEEGWFKNPFVLNDPDGISPSSVTYSLNTAFAYTSGPAALCTTVVVGASNNPPFNDHHLKIEFKDGGGSWNQLTDTHFEGYVLNKFDYSILPNQLGNSTDFKFSTLADPGFESNRSAVSYIYLKYPHAYNLESATSFKLIIPQNTSQAKSLLNITGFNSLGSTARLYDITDNRRITVVPNGPDFNSLISNSASGAEKFCYITSDNDIPLINSIQPVNGTGTFTDFTTLGVNDAYLIVSNLRLKAEVDNYAAYRQSAAGGSHNVVTAYIDELYDQFAYGIVKHPLAIKRFADLTLDFFPNPPEYLFLIGKGILGEYSRSGVNYQTGLLPVFGTPGSDVLFTAGLTGGTIEQGISTGRLSAYNLNDVKFYLDKVKEFESNAPAEWMKNILHFGGGDDAGQQQLLAGYLKGFESTIEDTLFGGNVTTFLKTSSAPIQINYSDNLKRLIEGGVSMMTFFGHASGTGFDQNIDSPENYNNKGKYPFLLANSCYPGNIFADFTTHSESFVLIPEKGTIAYLGSSSVGYANLLNVYSSELYRNISYKLYGQALGKSVKETIKLCDSYGFFEQLTALEMTFHGDPAIVLNSFPKPDYTITENDVSFDLKSKPDSFTVYSAIKNLGKAIRDSFVVEYTRTFPDNDTIVYYQQVKTPLFKDTIAFKLPFDAKGTGLNKLQVRLDVLGKIDEMNETNNITVADILFFIPGGEVVPVYPYKFAVIPNDTVTLKASTGDPFATIRTYKFELDTTDAFTSPIRSGIIAQPGGVVTWKPSITFTDSTVYFWRVAAIPETGDTNWRESSFQYIQGKRGWGQAHFFQFKNDGFQFVKYNRQARSFDFVNEFNSLKAQTIKGLPWEWFNHHYEINHSMVMNGNCADGLSFAVFDSISGKPWESQPLSAPNLGFGQYGNWHCDPGRTLPAIEFFTTDAQALTGQQWRRAVTNFINNIPSGYNVLMYTEYNHNAKNYEDSLYTAIESIGSTKIRTLEDSLPYILFGKKGNGPGHEVVGTSSKELITLVDSIQTNWNDGFIASEMIGPARAWGSLHWREHALEAGSKDSIYLRVIGIKADGVTNVTLQDFPRDSADVYDLASYADASIYPYIKLIAYMKDDSLRTSPQLDRWQVLYTPVPEGAINLVQNFTLNKDTLQEGDNLKLTMAFQNISEYDFTDSLLVQYRVEDENGNITTVKSALKWPPLLAGKTLIDSVTINTENFAGKNHLWVEFNPINNSNTMLEQYHFNNIAHLEFLATKDRINPLLDVTFDGVHILSGDIVSAKPNIIVQLKDENQFLALDDETDFSVYLKKPGAAIEEKIDFGTNMAFSKAILPNNSCKINFNPVFSEDGTYRLRVQAKDKSDNESGAVDYKIDFEVVNRSSITEVLNYPNPFSTSTRFVFTLTGSEIPQYFKIQIMTVTGKVIKEIDASELGPVHIGRNITEYAWDGKDDFGDQLANGIYLYRVQTQLNGAGIEKRESGADQFITKGFGKMYLIR